MLLHPCRSAEICLHVAGMLMGGLREESRERGPLKTTFNVHVGNDLHAGTIKSSKSMKSHKDSSALALGMLPILIHAQLCPTIFKSRSGGDEGGTSEI